MFGQNFTRFETSRLSIATEVSGPSTGIPIILVHGWPDDARTWDRMLPGLHNSGYRTIAPYLRGFGPTSFLSNDTKRSGQLVALGQDLLELADAMELERFAVAGHDWGARAAYIAACFEPQRISSCIAFSVGWGTNDPSQSISLKQIQNYWYQWYMAIDQGEKLLREKRHEFTQYIWDLWNPSWEMAADEFIATSRSFDNPDWFDICLDSYRIRWGLVPDDPDYALLEERINSNPQISVPTLVIHGGIDPGNGPETSENREHFFDGPYHRVVLENVGHFPQRQAPQAVLDAVLPFLNTYR